MQEIGARLKKLILTSNIPAELAEHYAKAFQLENLTTKNQFVCQADQVQLEFKHGESGQLYQTDYVFNSKTAFDDYRQLIEGKIEINDLSTTEFTVKNPLGHIIHFSINDDSITDDAESLRLQHFAVRAIDIDALSDFYENTLGFTISDRVYNENKQLTAIFIRTDHEHHSFAIFKSPINRFDHFSCEIQDWSGMKKWADHMAKSEIELAWGIGRHGPGNDTFFMIKDADGNMGEISAELEQCTPNRPVGIWKHHPLTLNQWGVAIMRC
ncbi:VOC family protein [Acinetobacter pragensis]|uniref:VOC domain-containing protein n=1 Tax=Acinetobacter pragensis TaxID=1806892 RepID=A0A151Y3Y1_9GAMM|nr:VOC family protein [Acinetobacter pragensis]KYQ72741.1 hypothetical protein AZH43_07745 [Acinetobacter pragensis]